MALMKQKPIELNFPTWFVRPFDEFPALWRDLLEEPMIKVEEFVEGDQHVVRAELPGIDPDKDIEITMADGRLHMRVERSSKATSDDKQGFRSEFQYGSFERTMRLPAGATEADVTASYKDGILELRIPIDTDKAESKRIPVSRS